MQRQFNKTISNACLLIVEGGEVEQLQSFMQEVPNYRLI